MASNSNMNIYPNTLAPLPATMILPEKRVLGYSQVDRRTLDTGASGSSLHESNNHQLGGEISHPRLSDEVCLRLYCAHARSLGRGCGEHDDRFS
jgi:hypothetical protein